MTQRDDDGLDALIEEITVDAHNDDERLSAFQQAMEDEVKVPVDGFVIGEPVSVVGFGYDGNERRGLTAKCRRADVLRPTESVSRRCRRRGQAL